MLTPSQNRDEMLFGGKSHDDKVINVVEYNSYVDVIDDCKYIEKYDIDAADDCVGEKDNNICDDGGDGEKLLSRIMMRLHTFVHAAFADLLQRVPT